jgi:N-acetylglucosaminyl-diphospho-decaprenol L-rhamnosyltransferase
MPEIGIVIVTYNSGAHIGSCLDAALRSGAQVVVVDNASADQTCNEAGARGITVIANAQNRGFAGAVNQGIRALDTPYILLLNPDATLQTGLEHLRACCDRPSAAGAGGKLLDSAGRPQIGFMFRCFPSTAVLIFESLGLNRLWPHNPVNWQFRCLGNDYNMEQPVEQPAGAFLMIRRDVWERLGGFDEGFYPLWFEDVDFARRAACAGYRMFYIPRAVAKHTGAHSIDQIPLEIRARYWYGSLLRYVSRHFGPWAVRGVCVAVIVGSFARMVSGTIAQRNLKPIVAYAQVAIAAGRSLVGRRKHERKFP